VRIASDLDQAAQFFLAQCQQRLYVFLYEIRIWGRHLAPTWNKWKKGSLKSG
jgi:hypothetical protein